FIFHRPRYGKSRMRTRQTALRCVKGRPATGGEVLPSATQSAKRWRPRRGVTTRGFPQPEEGMRSRALSLATVAILVGLIGLLDARFGAVAENLEAGKSPQKIFNDTCTACHKSSRGLLKTVPANTLPGFLRQHYTTSADMASALSAYLLSGGGATEHVAEPKQGKKD